MRKMVFSFVGYRRLVVAWTESWGVIVVVVIEEVAWLKAAASVNVRTKTVVPGVRTFIILCKLLLEPSATRSPASEAASGVFDDKYPCTSFSEG